MIVVDANVLAYALIDGERTAAARAVFEKDPDWRLPSLWRHELLNVLATYARHGGAPVAKVRAIWRTALERFTEGEEPVDGEAVLDLAVEHGISAYDAQYAALAQRLDVELVTEDRRLLRALPAVAISMREFLGVGA